MPRKRNTKETVKITISTAPGVAKYLDRLIEKDLYGKTHAEVVDSLLKEKIRDLIRARELKEGSKK